MIQIAIALIFIGSWAQPAQARDIDDILLEQEQRAEVRARLFAAASACLDQDFHALKCEIRSPGVARLADNEFYQALSETGIAITKVGTLELLSGPVIGLFSRRKAGDPRADEARKYLVRVNQALRMKVESQKLDTCHSVCLVQCFVSNSLKYDDVAFSSVFNNVFANNSDRGAEETAGRGEGICRNYSTLGQQTGSELGIDLERVATHNLGHNVTGYVDGGQKYLADMQDNPLRMGACVRYPW